MALVVPAAMEIGMMIDEMTGEGLMTEIVIDEMIDETTDVMIGEGRLRLPLGQPREKRAYIFRDDRAPRRDAEDPYGGRSRRDDIDRERRRSPR